MTTIKFTAPEVPFQPLTLVMHSPSDVTAMLMIVEAASNSDLMDGDFTANSAARLAKTALDQHLSNYGLRHLVHHVTGQVSNATNLLAQTNDTYTQEKVQEVRVALTMRINEIDALTRTISEQSTTIKELEGELRKWKRANATLSKKASVPVRKVSARAKTRD